MSNNILVIAEQHGGVLNPATAKTVACARQIEHETLDLAVFAADAAPAEHAAKLDGVGKVIWLADAGYAQPTAVGLEGPVLALAQGYTHILAPATSFGRDVLPRVAAKLNVPQISEIVAVESARIFKRPIYAGNALVTVQAPPGIVVGTVRANAFKPVTESGAACIEKRETAADQPEHTRFVSLVGGSGDRPDLQAAARVLAGGRGVGTQAGFAGIFKLADAMGAAVGASRAAVDAGFVPNDLQIGQTSKIIAPDLYIAFGISGAFQHLAGIKDAGVIVAVNTDPNAPIFEVADIGLVADLFEVIPQLEQALANK